MLGVTNKSCTFGDFISCHDLFSVFLELNPCNPPSNEVDTVIIISIGDEDIDTGRLSNLPEVTQLITSRSQISHLAPESEP